MRISNRSANQVRKIKLPFYFAMAAPCVMALALFWTLLLSRVAKKSEYR